jgi:hypothetical protein
VTHANVNEIPTERLKDYASTNKDMLYGEKDGSGYSTAAEAQAFFDATVSRHDDLRAEHNRRKELKECPSNESISSLGSIRDHKYSEENFRDQDSNEPLHCTETEENDPGSFSNQPGSSQPGSNQPGSSQPDSSNNKRRLSSDEEMDEPNSKMVKTEKIEGSSSEGFSGQGSSNQGTSNTVGNQSKIDFVLELQSCEMPDIYEADGGE